MADRPSHRPWRFRRRLTGAFLIVAAVAGGIVSTTSYLLIDTYRNRSFEESAERDAEVAMLVAPGRLSLDDIEELLTRLSARGGFDVVARRGDLTFASSSAVGYEDVPADLRTPRRDEGAEEPLLRRRTTVDGDPYLVIVGNRPGEAGELYFFFPRSDLLQGLRDFRDVLVLGWLAAVAAAFLLGRMLTRRTLRPVRDAAQASRDIAEGLLATRVEPGSDDEFGAWAEAFNDMAAALEQKVSDLAAAAARERRFTGDVAHELRTPLTSMVSASELLEMYLDDLPQSARRPAELLIADVRRFRRLVIELLELARLDAAAAEGLAVDEHRETLAVREAVAAALARSGITDASVDIADDAAVAVGDRVRFARVMTNLLANAVEHGGGRVRIVARREDDHVSIDVTDRGPGIPESELPHIFDRFHKGDGARSAGGAGLGLAIARQHAEAQGGTLRVANDPSGGARFTFVLPAGTESILPAGGDSILPAGTETSSPVASTPAAVRDRDVTQRAQ